MGGGAGEPHLLVATEPRWGLTAHESLLLREWAVALRGGTGRNGRAGRLGDTQLGGAAAGGIDVANGTAIASETAEP